VSETIGVPPLRARMSFAVTRRLMISADKARFLRPDGMNDLAFFRKYRALSPFHGILLFRRPESSAYALFIMRRLS
jgi:hypothetical protein